MRNAIFIFIIIFVGSLQAFADVRPANFEPIEIEAERGKSYDVELLLNNSSSRSERVKIYPGNYVLKSGHAQAVKNHGRSLAAWISGLRPEYNLQAGISRIKFKVKIPKKLKVSGSFFVWIYVEPVAAAERKGFVKIQRRFAWPVIFNVAGVKRLEFGQSVYDEETKQFSIEIRNTGSRILRLAVSAQVGNNYYKLERILKVYPDDSRPAFFDIDLVSGIYKAIIIADAGASADLFGAVREFEIGQAEREPLTVTTIIPVQFRIFGSHEMAASEFRGAYETLNQRVGARLQTRIAGINLHAAARWNSSRYNSYTAGVNFSLFRRLRLTGHANYYKDLNFNLSATLQAGRFLFSAAVRPQFEDGNFSIRCMIGGGYVNLRSSYSEIRGFNFGIDFSLPLDFNISITREIRQPRAVADPRVIRFLK